MRTSVLLVLPLLAVCLASCQTAGEGPARTIDFRSNANKAKTDDPIAALGRY